jgi:hypothetical protein
LRWAVYIKGSTEGTDTYNNVNNLCFVGISAEGSYIPFYLYNAQCITFISCRTESATYFAESNKASDHVIIGGYGTKKINYTGSERVSDNSWNYSTLVDVDLSNFHPVSNGVLCDVGGNSNSDNKITSSYYSGKIENGLLTRTNSNYGIEVDTSTFKLLNVEMDTAGRFIVAYFDSEGNNITSDYSSVIPSLGMYFSSNRFMNGGNVKSASIAIPAGVSKCTINTNANFSRFVIKGRYPEMGVLKMSNHTPSQGATSERPTYYPLSDLFYDMTLGKFIANNGSWVDVDGNPADASHSGTSSSRPTGVKVGFQYFDTTLGKPIYYNGTSWVDATGATV